MPHASLSLSLSLDFQPANTKIVLSFVEIKLWQYKLLCIFISNYEHNTRVQIYDNFLFYFYAFAFRSSFWLFCCIIMILPQQTVTKNYYLCETIINSIKLFFFRSSSALTMYDFGSSIQFLDGSIYCFYYFYRFHKLE